MVVGVVRVELHIPVARSIKDKRQVVRGLKDRLREHLRASVAEVEHQDVQRAALGLAVVSADGAQVREQLDEARRIVDREFAAVVTDWQERIE